MSMKERLLIIAISLLVLAGAVVSSLRRSILEAAMVLAAFSLVLLVLLIKSHYKKDED